MQKSLVMMMMLGALTTANAKGADSDLRALRDNIQSSWAKDSKTGAWKVRDGIASKPLAPPRCQFFVDKLASEPDTSAIKFSSDIPDFPKGDHTLAEARQACAHIGRMTKVKAVEFWAEQAMKDFPKLEGENFEYAYYRSCVEVYDRAIKLGMAPTDEVAERQLTSSKTNQPYAWKGPIEAIYKEWCEAGMAKAKEQIRKREAKYRAVLKGKKLEMALEDPYYQMPGGNGTTSPAELAASNVWFRDASPGKTCPDGQEVHTLHRYEFDAGGRMNQTDKDFCGDIPGSAYR